MFSLFSFAASRPSVESLANPALIRADPQLVNDYPNSDFRAIIDLSTSKNSVKHM